jgi:hypothetical protein
VGSFALGDLCVLNVLTIVTEFIGVSLALGYFGASRYVAVPVAGLALIAVTASGGFRRWERVIYVLLVLNLAVVPLALFAHSRAGGVTGGVGVSAARQPPCLCRPVTGCVKAGRQAPLAGVLPRCGDLTSGVALSPAGARPGLWRGLSRPSGEGTQPPM